MSIWKATLIAGSALGTLLTLGVINTATSNQGYHSSSASGDYANQHYGAGQRTGHLKHPVYGYMFKHPVYGYKFKHPVHGYIPVRMHGHQPGSQQGKMGYDGMKNVGYRIKTGSHNSGSGEAVAPQANIVETAVGAGNFNTLVTALKAADLMEILEGLGPFTVFAPTDEAFAKIPKADLDALLADKDKLAAVLTYHVVPGQVLAVDVVKMSEAKTVQGGSVKINSTDGVKVDDATVIKTDILTSNGVIHVIDTVIAPM